MSTQNQNTNIPAVTPPPKAKEPVFDNPEDNIKQATETSAMQKVGARAQAKLESVENNFVSLNSQRQLNLIFGSLIVISALTGGFGMLISIILGTFMIIQAVTGNMLLNDFIDSIENRHKKYFIPVLFTVIALIVISYLAIGFIGVGES